MFSDIGGLGLLTRYILLFSKDRTLLRHLQEAVAETVGSELTVEVGSVGQPAPPDSLCVWDFVPGETLLPRAGHRDRWRRSLFLLHRKDLAALRAVIGQSRLSVLLKPVGQAGLRAFLAGYALGNNEPPYDNDSGDTLTALRSERDEVLQILMQASLTLQESHQQRANFLARSIHDFRAPLTAISGYCELLLGDELESLTLGQRKILQRMQHSVRRLTCATDSMSRLSLAENAEPAVNLEKADIRDCIGQALEELSAVLENKRVSVTVEVEPPPENLLFENAQIEHAVGNLLESACKFTSRGGAIEIRGYPFFWDRRSGRMAPLPDCPDRRTKDVKTSNSFRVDISDSGPAIRSVDVDKLFEEGTSYSGGQDRSGAGLGMAVCRMILSQHGGHVWAESSQAGAVFSFVLPLYTDPDTCISCEGRVPRRDCRIGGD